MNNKMKTSTATLYALIAVIVISFTTAFVVSPIRGSEPTTSLKASRRDFLVSTMGIIAAASVIGDPALAFQSPRYSDDVPEPSQMPTNGKFDLNGAFVGEYKQLPGMFPHAAGKIASNGPYKSVKDIYKIPGLTENDVKMFQKYESEFTVNPPGRMFNERINNRVST